MSPPRPRAQRLLLLAAGYLCLGLAVIGAVLPLMPTTIFLILAAWCFGRASPALRARLHADPRFGPTLRAWEENGTISPRAKRAALLAMGVSWLVVALLFRDMLASALSGACLAAVALYIVTRPSPPREAPEPGRICQDPRRPPV